MLFVCLPFFLSCPEWEKAHRSGAQREACQLCCLHPKDIHSQGSKQSAHRHTNLYLWYRDGWLQVSGHQCYRWKSVPGLCASLSCCWCLFLLVLIKLCVMCRSSLLDQGMLVNIQQPVIQSDGTLLLATDSKVELQLAPVKNQGFHDN